MSSPSEREPGVRLLTLFDALVRRDVDSPGLEGSVAIGVDATWWRADFDEGAITEFSEAKPSADVQVHLSVPAAEGVLTSGALPERGALHVEGDGALFTRFIKRYTEKRSWLDIRRVEMGILRKNTNVRSRAPAIDTKVGDPKVSGDAKAQKLKQPEEVTKAQQALQEVLSKLQGTGFDAGKAPTSRSEIDAAQAAQVVQAFVDNLGVGDEKTLLSRLNALGQVGELSDAVAAQELSPEVRAQICEAFGPIGDLFFLGSKKELDERRPAVKAQAELVKGFRDELGAANTTSELLKLGEQWVDAPLPNVARNELMKKIMDKATKEDPTPFAAAAQMWETHADANPAFKSDEIAREFHIVCLNKAGKIDESVGAARAYIAELTGQSDFKVDLDNVQGAPLNGEVLAAVGKAFKVAGETVEKGGQLSAGMKAQILEEVGLDPKNPPADFDFAKAALDVSTRYYEAGFAKDFEYYPGIVSVYNNIEKGDDKRAMALAPLVWEACEASGGKNASDYWCLATQVELGLILDKGTESAELLPKMLSRANKNWEISSTVDKMSRLLEQRKGAGQDVTDLAFVVDKLSARLEMLDKLDGQPDDVVKEKSAGWLKKAEAEIQAHFNLKTPELDDETKLRMEITEKLFGSSGDFAGMTASHAVGGNVQYGGQITDMTISRRTVRLAEQYLQEAGLGDINDPKAFDQALNGHLNKLLHLEDDKGNRPMEDLHSPEHKQVLDPFDQNKIKVLECNTSGDSRTDILAILGFGIGDCRPTGFAKQLFSDVWKKMRHGTEMRTAFGAALSGDGDTAKSALQSARQVDNFKVRTMTARIDAPREMKEMYAADNDPETGLPQRSKDGEYQQVENHTFNIAFEIDDDGLVKLDTLRTCDGFYQREYELGDTKLDANQILSENGFEGNLMGVQFSDGGDIPIRLLPSPYSGALLKDFDVGSTDFLVGGHAVAPATFSSITEGHDRLFWVGQFFARADD